MAFLGGRFGLELQHRMGEKTSPLTIALNLIAFRKIKKAQASYKTPTSYVLCVPKCRNGEH